MNKWGDRCILSNPKALPRKLDSIYCCTDLGIFHYILQFKYSNLFPKCERHPILLWARKVIILFLTKDPHCPIKTFCKMS